MQTRLMKQLEKEEQQEARKLTVQSLKSIQATQQGPASSRDLVQEYLQSLLSQSTANVPSQSNQIRNHSAAQRSKSQLTAYRHQRPEVRHPPSSKHGRTKPVTRNAKSGPMPTAFEPLHCKPWKAVGGNATFRDTSGAIRLPERAHVPAPYRRDDRQVVVKEKTVSGRIQAQRAAYERHSNSRRKVHVRPLLSVERKPPDVNQTTSDTENSETQKHTEDDAVSLSDAESVRSLASASYASSYASDLETAEAGDSAGQNTQEETGGASLEGLNDGSDSCPGTVQASRGLDAHTQAKQMSSSPNETAVEPNNDDKGHKVIASQTPRNSRYLGPVIPEKMGSEDPGKAPLFKEEQTQPGQKTSSYHSYREILALLSDDENYQQQMITMSAFPTSGTKSVEGHESELLVKPEPLSVRSDSHDTFALQSNVLSFVGVITAEIIQRKTTTPM